jgi:hypothetical protein
MAVDVMLGVEKKVILVEFAAMDTPVYVHHRLRAKVGNMFGDNIN